MKKLIVVICISLFFSISLQAQMSKEGRDKIKALKIAYLTEQINLTTDEAQKFWPIYNAYIKEQIKIRNNYRDTLRKNSIKNKVSSLDENEAKKLVNLKLQTDKDLYESQIKFVKKVVGVISYKKIIQLQIAEMEFGRKLMRKYKRERPDSKD
jgi:hypothetical protein